MHDSPLRQGISDRNGRFCYPFVYSTSTSEIPSLSYATGLKKGTPLGRSLPVQPITERSILIFRRVPRPFQNETNPCFKPIFLLFRCLCFPRMTRRGETKKRGGLWERKGKNRGSLPLYFIIKLCGGEKSPSHLVFAPDARCPLRSGITIFLLFFNIPNVLCTWLNYRTVFFAPIWLLVFPYIFLF